LDAPELDRVQRRKFRATLETGTGKFNITRITFGNLIPGQRDWIDFMEFEVELCVPYGAEA
jgi:hypothetical protein